MQQFLETILLLNLDTCAKLIIPNTYIILREKIFCSNMRFFTWRKQEKGKINDEN